MKKLCMLMIFSALLCQAGDPPMKTINVHFTGTELGEIQVSVPISITETVKPQIEKALDDLQNSNQSIDFVGLWKGFTSAEPGQFLVSINNDDINLKCTANETHFLVNFHEKKEDKKMEVKVSLEIGEALFGDGEELSYEKIVAVLETISGTNIVEVTSPDLNGRVWIE